ncbi:unnamed protein product, partial [Clonostachys byssicola]
ADSRTSDGDRGRAKMLQPLSLPKNRSTGNLVNIAEQTDRSRYRMSFDASTSPGLLDHDALTRSASIIGDHEHGLGASGLRRIRQQQPPSRKPTLPGSAASSRSPSVVALSRTPSLSAMLSSSGNIPLSSVPASPSFSEDLSRFPSESLHSFSFAHQSEEFIHNRQNVLKRSLEFMKDRMGLPMNPAQAGLASAQARASGDVEAQNMLELLARAQLIGAGNLPNPDPSESAPPLTGPPDVAGDDYFERHLIPRSASPEPLELSSPTSLTLPPARFPPAQQATAQKANAAGRNVNRLVTASPDVPSRRPPNFGSPPALRPITLKRTMTDTLSMSVQDKLIDTMAQPYFYQDSLSSPNPAQQTPLSATLPSALGPTAHGHTNRWVPAAQAIFTTEAKPPWTIIAANDLACLVFGVTKAEVRKTGIMEVVQEERRSWLERRLLGKEGDELDEVKSDNHSSTPASSAASALLGGRSGITAQLLSKPNSRSQSPRYPERRAQTVHSGDPNPPKISSGNHRSARSRGVLLCGDIVPIQKRNGATGSASLWVKEKRVGLIWVLEEIHEDTAFITIDEEGIVSKVSGDSKAIWGLESVKPGVTDVCTFIPRIPRQGIDPNTGEIDFAQVRRRKFFTCPNARKVNIPCTIEQTRGKLELRVSSYPHIAGMIVLDPSTLHIRSSNSVFCGALFGFEKPDGMSINALVPGFDTLLDMLTDGENLELVEGMVVPEDRFRRASGLLAIREHRPDISEVFLKPAGLPAKHRDGSDLRVDVQMRVVKSEKQITVAEETVIEGSDEDDHAKQDDTFNVAQSELVYALWITYSRHLHAEQPAFNLGSFAAEPAISSPLHQPSPGQTPPAHTPAEIPSDEEISARKEEPSRSSPVSSLQQFKDVALSAAAKITGQIMSSPTTKTADKPSPPKVAETSQKKTIEDYAILEDMGQGAYGQVKLARHKTTGRKVVLKYVTKRRILVDTWTRDRKLGTVPLEIHVLDYLRKPEFRHPNIVEMEGFFEDSINYYIEMAPHGLPGMDLFDYIELRTNMDEPECRSIFNQVAQAISFLHTIGLVVHRDIKDENVILDGEGNIKLIDFGSAAYIKSGPFDVFVGTIDYAAPEVLAGKPYGGKEQDVWALGILLYTIIYKENPFYSIDEIMDRDLRIPFIMSEESIDLIRCMLDRDVSQRYDITKVIEHPWLTASDQE